MRIKLFFLLLIFSGCVKSQPIKALAGTRTKAPTAFVSTYDLTFTNSTDIANTGQIFTAAGGAFGYGHTGVDNLNIPAGKTGRIYYKVTNSGAVSDIFSFDTTNLNHGYTHFLLGLSVADPSLEYFNYQPQFGGFFASGYTISPPQWIGVYKAGASFKTQVSNDGKSWSDINIPNGFFYTFTTDTVWPVVDMHTTARLDSPRIDIYSKDKTDKLYLSNGNSIAHGALPAGGLSDSSIGNLGWYALDTTSEWFYNNHAVNGQSIDAALTAFPLTTKPLLAGQWSKILISYLEGTNQMAPGTGAPPAFIKLIEYIDTCLAQRPEIQMLIYMTPSCNPAVGFTNAQRNQFNDSIATLPTKYPGKVKVVDIRGDAILDGATSYSNTTYFWDGTHMTDRGYAYYASLGAAVLVTFGYGKYMIIFLLFAVVATKAEGKIVSMNQRRKAA